MKLPSGSNQNLSLAASTSSDPGLQRLVGRLTQSLERDTLVQATTSALRGQLNVDRVLLYYFYSRWQGQVTFESLSDPSLSIYGSIGPDECFNDEYAALYEAGRLRAIPDIEAEPIAPCHQDMLRQMQVRANLVVPILTERKGLWGLLVAHHLQARSWSDDDLAAMRQGAADLAVAPAIAQSVS